jgi:hypothetical protein
MGTWGYGNLENDTAADFIGNFRDNPTAEGLTKILHHVNKLSHADKYLEASDCEEALAAVELVAASRNKPTLDLPSDIQILALNLKLEQASDYAEFYSWSVRAVWFIREESELRDLWEEAGDLTKWREMQENLLERLK